MTNILKKRRIFFILLAFALVILFIIASLKPGPQKQENKQFVPVVEVAIVSEDIIDPIITGFGRAFAHEQWQAISEVTGRVIYRHPELEVGRNIAAQTVVLKVDPVDYELTLAQSQSLVKSAELDLKRIGLNEKTLRQNLKIAENQLTLAQNELSRKSNLNTQGLVSSSELEAQRTRVLQQEQVVWDAQQKLELVPSDKELAQANLNSARAKLIESERKLSRTQIVMPFNGRISNVNIALDQIVNPQQIMLEAYDLSLMEVTANISVNDITTLLQSTSGEAILPGQTMPDIRNLGLQARVSYSLGQRQFTWDASVNRVSGSIDARANTIGITVQIINTPQNYDPKIKPPLLKDMYVQVDIFAPGKSGIVVPDSALHNSFLYVLDEVNKLKFVPVQRLYSLNGKSLVEAAVTAGDKVVTTDLLAPVEGMLVQPASESGSNPL